MQRLTTEQLISITSNDKELLRAIYSMRILSRDLIREHITKDVRRLSYLEKWGILEKEDYKGDSVYWLSALGIKVIREEFKFFGLEEFKASELKMKPHIYDHQLSLNSFAFKAMKIIPDGKYVDGKFMPKCSGFLLPDGMIETKDCLYLLEMDMGTERGEELTKRWMNYRGFLNYPGDYYYQKKIRCLFVLDGVKNYEVRALSVAASIHKCIIDLIGPDFDVYTGSADTILSLIEKGFYTDKLKRSVKNLKSLHRFSVMRADFSNIFSFYLKKSCAGKVVVKDGRAQEYLLGSLLEGGCLDIAGITFFGRYQSKLKRDAKRNIPLVILVPSEKWAAALLNRLKIEMPSEIFFATPERIEKRAFCEALFILKHNKADRCYEVHGFTDEGLKATRYEKKYQVSG